MRSRILLASLMGFSTFFAPAHLFGEKKRTTASLNVKQQVDLELFNLRKNIKKSASQEEKFKFFERTENKIQSLRQQIDSKNENDELYMDLVLICLGEIPRDELFKKDRCDIYKKSMMSKFDPTADIEPKHPAVKRVVSVLNTLCK